MRYAARTLKIGSFSAASNVTGIATDTVAVSTLLHQHGALSFWDYAAAGPVREDRDEGGRTTLAYKDAVFISPHKFIGGPQTPGVLVVKRALLVNTVPACPGGGTVAYVNQEEHRYVDDPVMREEGGTPAIIESIRAGLVFQLKEAVGADAIREREVDFIDRAIASWSTNPNIAILGNKSAWRLSIVSFIIRHRNAYLHHNFIVALLNDLFGIQSRGGCGCAGPYGHRLLGIDIETSKEFEREIVRGCEGIKPGWVRVNFNYFLSRDAVPVHPRRDPPDRERRLAPACRTTASIPTPASGATARTARGRDAARRDLVSHRQDGVPLAPLDRARVGAARLHRRGEAHHRGGVRRVRARSTIEERPRTADFEELRWFPLPSEVLEELRGQPTGRQPRVLRP